MDTEGLERIGFTQREIRVYLALLEIGTSSVGRIIQKSGVPGSKIYETLDKLKERGFVSSIIRENKQFFTPSQPESIIDYLDEQRRDIAETLIPRLKVLANKDKNEREATHYEGINGIKAVYEKMLREAEPILVLGAPKIAQEKLEGYFLDFNRRRSKKGIRMKIIYQSDAKKFGQKREKMNLTDVRYLRKDMIAPAWIDIFGDYIVIFSIEDKPAANLIRDKSISQSFKMYFNMIWDSVKE